MSSVLTIILNWRTPAMTIEACASALTAMEGIAGAITIVDNDSGDGSFEAMSEAVAARGWDRVRVIQAGRNGGFGAGNNLGIRAGLPDGGRADYVYVLNSDAFPAPDAIRLLRDHLDTHPRAGFAGSHIHGDDGVTHLTTFRFPSIASEFEGAMRFGPVSRLFGHRKVPREMPAGETPVVVDWLAGASLMMRMDCLEEIGLFDEVFFLYFEETDLCLRLNRAGWQVHYVPCSHVMHIGSVSTGMKKWARVPDYWFNSRWHYFQKNHGRGGAALASLAHLAGGAFHRIRRALTGKKPDDPPHFWRSLAAHDLRALFAPARKPQTGPESRDARL